MECSKTLTLNSSSPHSPGSGEIQDISTAQVLMQVDVSYLGMYAIYCIQSASCSIAGIHFSHFQPTDSDAGLIPPSFVDLWGCLGYLEGWKRSL